jgi:hypothetical protein
MPKVLAQVTISFWKMIPDHIADVPGEPDQGLPDEPGKPGHLPARPTRPVDPGYGVPEGGEPPIIWPGDPSQGLPPMIGWPLPPDPSDPTTKPLPKPPAGIWPRPPVPGQPLPPSDRPPKPGHPIARPPIHFPGKPDQGLPPMVGYPLPPDICNPPPGSPEWPDQSLPGEAQPK